MQDNPAQAVLAKLEASLNALQASRRDPEQYVVLAQQLLDTLNAIKKPSDHSDFDLVGKSLVREFVFAAKSAELRHPAASTVSPVPAGRTKY